MSELPSIYNPSPIVLPAQDETTFPDSYLISMNLMTPSKDGKQQIKFVLRPYNKSTKAMYPGVGKDTTLTFGDVFAEAARVPIFAQTMGLLLTAVSLGLHEKTLVCAIDSLEENDPELVQLNAELAQVRTAMGMQ